MPGLVLEGGTFRPVFSCGVMDALLDHDIMFDYVVGVSAGITYAISYLSRQRGRNLEVLRRYRGDSRYFGVRNLPHDHSIFGTDFVFDTIPNQLIPFDWETYHRYKGRILVGVTNAETGRAEYLDGAKLDRTCTMLRATCAIPLYFPAVQLSGGTFYDGGVADPIPIVRSLHDGNRKNLIVLTQPKSYRKTLTRGLKFAAHALHRLPDGYDAVFCFNTSPVLMCWPAIRYAKKHHIPFTNYVLDIWPENLYSVLNVKNKALRAIAQGVSDALYKKADRLIAMSEPLQQRLCQRTGMPPQKIAVIPQYCEDFYAFPQPDAALQAQFGGRFNLVFTGTFTPAQSLETVITAVQDARSRGADMLHLLLVGDGMSRAALEAKVKELHAEDAVTFYGSVPATDIPKFTALADALIVCLSDSPDLGLTVPAKVASYMAAGKPVLASMDGAGNAAVAAAGGLSSPACDAAALADNLLALTRMDAAQRAAMGQSAKEYYLAHYRRSELLRKLEHFILEGRV